MTLIMAGLFVFAMFNRITVLLCRANDAPPDMQTEGRDFHPSPPSANCSLCLSR